MKTLPAKPEQMEERWFLVDAKNQVLGRLAARVAHILRGKDMPTFTPHANMKAHVVVVNAADVKLTGGKLKTKTYYHHTGWPGGIKSATAEELQAKKPGEIIRIAVEGMLPKTRLGNALAKHLRIFPGPEHDHKAQRPQPIELHTRVAREEA